MNNIDKQYLDLLKDILKNGVEKTTRNGSTLSVFGRQIRHKMSDGFPLLTTKKMAWKTIVTELLWFLRGDTNIKFLINNNCHIWDGDAYKSYAAKTSMDVDGQLTKEEFINKIKTDDEFAKKWGELGPIYGAQWRNWEGVQAGIRIANEIEWGGDYTDKKFDIDQIANLINELKTNPDSRRLMVSAWNVGELDRMVLPPCHYGFQVYTRELSLKEKCDWLNKKYPLYGLGEWTIERLSDNDYLKEVEFEYNIPKRAISLMWNQRSVDVGLGLPFNIASYALLLEIIAKMTNMVPDELIGNLGDTHIYLNHVDGLKEQLNREPYELPKLNINTEFWPTESGECGVSPIDALSVLNSFSDDNFCKSLLEDDIQLVNYQSHPTIKLPLSN